MTAGRYELAGTSLRRAADLGREIRDRPRAAAALAALGESLISARRTEDALALLEPAAVEFADLVTDPGFAALRSQVARGHYFIGKPRLAIEELEPVLELAEHDDLTELLADALVTKGSALTGLGRVREGIGVIRTGADVARANGHTATLLRALRNWSVLEAFEVDASASRAQNAELSSSPAASATGTQWSTASRRSAGSTPCTTPIAIARSRCGPTCSPRTSSRPTRRRS